MTTIKRDSVRELLDIMGDDCSLIGFDGNDLLFMNQYGSYIRCCGSEHCENESFVQMRDNATYVKRVNGRYRPL